MTSQVGSLIGLRKNLRQQDLLTFKLNKVIPLTVAMILSINEDQQTDSLRYHTLILDELEVDGDSAERSWDFATLQNKYGF